jgi:hypothetical protein
MARFIRKNLITCTAVFAPTDGSNAAPLNAEAVLVYKNTSGSIQTDNVPLAVTNGVWTGTWDSSLAQGCEVQWMVHCWNGLIAAQEGDFAIVANNANTN